MMNFGHDIGAHAPVEPPLSERAVEIGSQIMLGQSKVNFWTDACASGASDVARPRASRKLRVWMVADRKWQLVNITSVTRFRVLLLYSRIPVLVGLPVLDTPSVEPGSRVGGTVLVLEVRYREYSY